MQSTHPTTCLWWDWSTKCDRCFHIPPHSLQNPLTLTSVYTIKLCIYAKVAWRTNDYLVTLPVPLLGNPTGIDDTDSDSIAESWIHFLVSGTLDQLALDFP